MPSLAARNMVSFCAVAAASSADRSRTFSSSRRNESSRRPSIAVSSCCSDRTSAGADGPSGAGRTSCPRPIDSAARASASMGCVMWRDTRVLISAAMARQQSSQPADHR